MMSDMLCEPVLWGSHDSGKMEYAMEIQTMNDMKASSTTVGTKREETMSAYA
jgi:hypothetical protein